MAKLAPRLDGLTKKVDSVIEDLLAEAYQRGADDMRALIVDAARSTPAKRSRKKPVKKKRVKAKRKKTRAKKAKKTAKKRTTKARAKKKAVKRRAPRGALDGALKLVLSKSPGLKMSEIQKKISGIDNRISANSIAPTLYRNEGKKYRSSKGKWYLKK